MARNPERRTALADAGIRVLAEAGARGLTHRRVDEVADLPQGTTSNYFPSRSALVGALIARIEDRLIPAAAVAEDLVGRRASRALFADYLRDVVRRLSADPHVALALFELRLESSRNPEVADALGAWRRQAFEADVAFNESRGLPGTRQEIALFHYAIDGLLLDHLTHPLDPSTDIDRVVDDLVAALLR